MSEIWTVYDHPIDEPRFFVARLFIGQTPSNIALHSENLDELRNTLQSLGLVSMQRSLDDDAKIIEIWL